MLTRLTPEALGALLGADVEQVAAEPLGTGQMCDSFRLTLTYQGRPDLPVRLVAKLPAADETSRATALLMRTYEKEVRFYQQLAPHLGDAVPSVLHADIDVPTGEFTLLLQDLAPALPGDQLAGCSPATAERVVDRLVDLHAPWWESPELLALPWLVGDEAGSRALLTGLLPSLWQGFRERYDPADHVVEAGERLFGDIAGHLAPREGPRTLVHGDFRLDNLMLGPTGAVTVLDWQTCAVGSGAGDLAYFVGASLAADERRACEGALLERYVGGLADRGVTGYGVEQCREDYRHGGWAGLVMAVGASMMVERTERGDAMFATMAARHAQHALDLASSLA